MGLDHYLMKKVYRENSNEEDYEILIRWRKENQIHGFFESMFNGIENCEYEYIPREYLNILLEHCKYVLDHPSESEDILPTQGGFFFGSTDYGDWYHESTARTYEKLKKILETEDENTKFYYYAWW